MTNIYKDNRKKEKYLIWHRKKKKKVKIKKNTDLLCIRL